MSSKYLLFDCELYDYQIICVAAGEYEQLAHILILHDGKNARCEFSDCVYDVDTTVKEFANYVLGLTVQKGAMHALG